MTKDFKNSKLFKELGGEDQADLSRFLSLPIEQQRENFESFRREFLGKKDICPLSIDISNKTVFYQPE